jgi:3-deoxy-D-manno-octulosonic-acid transferase
MRSPSMIAYQALGLVLSLLAAPLFLAISVSRRGSVLGERLGRVPDAARRLAAERPIWLHAASVGEVTAAAPLVAALRRQNPDRPLIISTTSLTGRAAAAEIEGVAATVLLPVDVGWIVKRTVRTLRASALVIVETEIWPALLQAAGSASVPIALVSGCISERTARRYRWIGPLIRAALAHVRVFAMQTQIDADRIIALGAQPDRVRVVGSLKYAVLGAQQENPDRLPGLNGRPVLVAASTHADEEELVLEACESLWRVHPDCLLILAPRRPERFDEVERLVRQVGARLERRTNVRTGVRPETQVVLLDSLGELGGLLVGARGAFVGGTITPLGGHNVLEPAGVNTPVCFGPSTDSVAEAAAALIAAEGGERVHDAAELRNLWLRLLDDPEYARQMGVRARSVVESRAGVLEETLAVIGRVMQEGNDDRATRA